MQRRSLHQLSMGERAMHSTEEASNDGRVKVRIINGINISHKELIYLLQKSTSHQKPKHYVHCRVVGATFANGWLIIVGAYKTSPVPGNGIRRRHARRRILPSFRALRGDNTPTAALRGLRMITMVIGVQSCSSSCVLGRGREQG